MHKGINIIFLLYKIFTFSLVFFSSFAEADFFFKKSYENQIITNISHLESALDINKIQKNIKKWNHQTSNKINFGFSDKNHWVKLNLKNMDKIEVIL